MRLLRLLLIMAELRIAQWHADRHERIVGRCRGALLALGCLDGEEDAA